MNTVAKYWEIFAKNLHLYLYCYNFGDFFGGLGLWSSVPENDPIDRGPWATGRSSRSGVRGHFSSHWVTGPKSEVRFCVIFCSAALSCHDNLRDSWLFFGLPGYLVRGHWSLVKILWHVTRRNLLEVGPFHGSRSNLAGNLRAQLSAA